MPYDPNVYYYAPSVTIRFLGVDESVASGNTGQRHVYLSLRLPEPIDGGVSLRLGGVSVDLIRISDRVWVGRVPWMPQIYVGGFVPMLLRFRHGDKQFYRSYFLTPDATKARTVATETGAPSHHWVLDGMPGYRLVETPDVARSEYVYPKGTAFTVQVPYQPIDHAANNFFNPATWDSQLGSANVSVKGIKTVSIRSKFKRGVKDDFQEGVQRDEMLRLTILAQYHDMELRASIQDSSTVLDDTNKNTIELRNKDGELFFGEYWARLNQTELMAYNKRLDGVRGQYRLGDYTMTAMVSESKGEAAFDRIYGKNSQGPYTLSQRPVVVYSETLRYQGRVLVRDVDYTLDYELGELTFKKEVVPDTDLFEMTYEYANTTYKKSFVAGYLSYDRPLDKKEATVSTATVSASKRVSPDMLVVSHMGVGFQRLADRGSEVSSGNETALTPGAHMVLGVDGRYRVSEVLTGKTEVAFSEKKTDVSDPTTATTGFAFQQAFDASFWNTGIRGRIKKVGDTFYSLGNAAIHPGFLAYGVEGDSLWVPWWRQSALYDYERYVENGGEVLSQSLGYTTQVDAFSYAYFQRTDRDLSVETSLFEKMVHRHTGSLRVDVPAFRLTPGYRVETVDDMYSPSQSYTSQAVVLGAQLLGPQWLQLSSSVEHRTQEKSTGYRSQRDTVGMSSAVSAGADYSLDGTVQYIQDSETGKSGLALANYTFRPITPLRFNGNYTLETLQEILGSTTYRVMKHQGNFQVAWRPVAAWRLAYRLRPTFSEVRLSGSPRYEDRLGHQYTASGELGEALMLGLDIRHSTKQLLDKSKLPSQVVSSGGSDRLQAAQLDYRLWEGSTLRYGVEHEASYLESLQSNSSPNAYETVQQNNLRHTVDYTYQWTPDIRLGTGYRDYRVISEQKIATASSVDTGTRTVEASTEWQVDRGLNLKVTAAASQTQDYKETTPDTYMTQPRVDWRWKPAAAWTLAGFFEISNAFSGQPTSRRKGSLSVRYDTLLAGLLDTTVSLQVDYESESTPRDYDVYDTLFKVTMTL